MTKLYDGRHLDRALEVGIDAATLPHNLEAERSVLGVILTNNAGYERIASVLTEASFMRDSHKRIYAAMRYLIEERSSAVDFVTLKEELVRRGELEDVGGAAFIAALADGMPRTTNITHYARIVQEKATLRELIFAANKMLTDAYAGEDPPDDIVKRADAMLLALQHARIGHRFASIQQSVPALFSDFEYRVAHRGQLTGLTTGFASLDNLTLGWQRGDLIVLAARPSIGKTTLAMNSATAMARAGLHVVFFSLEMRKRQLEYRIVSSLSGVGCARLLNGCIGGDDYAKISATFELLHTLPFAIDDSGQQTVQQIRGACRQLKAAGQCDAVVIDYVQLMAGTLSRKGTTRNEELTDISRRLKELADEINAPILLISQLRRLEARRRPQLEDLRESGALEQDADIVGFLYRKDHRAGGITELNLCKQRNGPTGTVKLSLDRDTLTFTDAGEQTAEEADAAAKEPTPARRRGRPPYLPYNSD